MYVVQVAYYFVGIMLSVKEEYNEEDDHACINNCMYK